MTIHVHPNIIRDLLPLYAAGEMSPETKLLVETHLANDPELAREAHALSHAEGLTPTPVTPASTRDPLLVGMERTKDLLRQRTGFLVGAITCTAIPFTVAGKTSPMRVTFFMLRDAPEVAGALLCAAAVFWVGFAWTVRRLRVAGL